jgi:hypothetical protein
MQAKKLTNITIKKSATVAGITLKFIVCKSQTWFKYLIYLSYLDYGFKNLVTVIKELLKSVYKNYDYRFAKEVTKPNYDF